VEGCASQYRSGKKVINPAPIDAFLEATARAELGMSESEDDEETQDLYLHYHTKASQLWLLQSWQAYRNRGILPYPGGFANQPRVWVRAIGRLNVRYAPVYDRLFREKYPDADKEKGEEILDWVRSEGVAGNLFDQIGEKHG